MTEKSLNVLRKIIKEEISSLLNEETIDKKYTHFLVDKNDNMIVNGWDYSNMSTQDIKDYFKLDIKDMGINPRNYMLLKLSNLKSKGIDPYDTNNWKNLK
jgi:hypothetical protein